MGNFSVCLKTILLHVKDWWILTGVAIIYADVTVRFIQWRIKMGIEKICDKIINDFNKIPEAKHMTEWRTTLMEKYKLSNKKARKCIKYLIENEFLGTDPMIRTLFWKKQ